MPMEAAESTEQYAGGFVEPEKLREGRCEGGPMDGQEIAVRCPLGFLVADGAARKAWVYRFVEPDRFVLDPDDDGSADRELDDDKAIQAMLGAHWDVVALPGPGEDDDGDQD